MFTNLKRITGGVIIQGLMPAMRKPDKIFHNSTTLFLKRRNISDNDFIYRRLSRVRLLCQSLSVITKNKMDIGF